MNSHSFSARAALRHSIGGIVALLFAGTALLAGAAPAAAHAELISSSPKAGATVQDPTSFSLRWNEIVQTGAAQLRLLNSAGTAAPLVVETVIEQGSTVALLTPTSDLTTGPWLISWKAVSADGHLISGAIPFSVVQSPNGITLPPSEPNSDPNTADQLGAEHQSHHPDHDEMMSMASLGSGEGGDGPLDRTAEAISWLAVLFAAGALLGLHRGYAVSAAVVGVALAGSRAAQISSDFGGAMLATGEAKAAASVAAAGALTLFGTAFSERAGRWFTSLTIAGAVTSFSAQSLFSGHHLDLEGTALILGTAAHAAHLLAMSVWVLAVVAAALNPTERQLRTTRQLSTISLPVLIVAGSVLAYLLIAPAGTAHGKDWLLIFAAKVALMFATVGLGWIHHRRTSKTSSNIGLVRWRRSLAAEVVLFSVIAALSSTLTLNAPPVVAADNMKVVSSDVTETNGGEETILSNPSEDSAKPGKPAAVEFRFPSGARGTLAIGSLTAATPSAWTLTLVDVDGQPLEVDSVSLEAANPALDLTGVDTTFTSEGSGRYVANHTLPVPGIWQIKLSFLLDQFTLEQSSVSVTALPKDASGTLQDTPAVGSTPASTDSLISRLRSSDAAASTPAANVPTGQITTNTSAAQPGMPTTNQEPEIRR